MTRFLLVGIPGNSSLTLVDLELGSAETISADSVDSSLAKAREAGETVFRGLDVAIAIDDRTDAVGRFFFAGGSGR